MQWEWTQEVSELLELKCSGPEGLLTCLYLKTGVLNFSWGERQGNLSDFIRLSKIFTQNLFRFYLIWTKSMLYIFRIFYKCAECCQREWWRKHHSQVWLFPNMELITRDKWFNRSGKNLKVEKLCALVNICKQRMEVLHATREVDSVKRAPRNELDLENRSSFAMWRLVRRRSHMDLAKIWVKRDMIVYFYIVQEIHSSI